MLTAKADVVFEVSWEVCNKVGGIYTVLTSKAQLMQKTYSNYFLIGPYTKKAEEEFEQLPTPEEFQSVFEQLRNEGISCSYGKWQIKGNPKVVLLDTTAYTPVKNHLKELYWRNYKIDALQSSAEFDEPLLFGTAAGKFVELYAKQCQQQNRQRKIVLHAHEWLAAFSILLVKLAIVKVATVFTTHATMLGRTISADNRALYDILESIDIPKEVYHYGIQDKHLTEVAAAKNCDMFTTVSEITALEAERFYGRKPEVLVLNGLDIDKFPSFEETAVQHRINREKMREFIAYYFFPYYYFDLGQTLLFFIVGRYEFKNKGIDLFIRALAQLNKQLQEQNSHKTIVVFFWIPRDVLSAKQELSSSKINYLRLKSFVHQNDHLIQQKMLAHLLSCDIKCYTSEDFSVSSIFNQDFLAEAKRMRLSFMKKGVPALTTHNLNGEDNDLILQSFIQNGLTNKQNDKVKVIFYPVYLSGVDGLIDLPYYEAITGCHLGLFPSYYEPWGYTPLESAALGVPSLTTDLGGFGRFLQQQHTKQPAIREGGIFVLQRMQKSEQQIINDFTEILYNYCQLHEKGRVQQKMFAKELAALADWNIFIDYYIDAANKAVERVYN